MASTGIDRITITGATTQSFTFPAGVVARTVKNGNTAGADELRLGETKVRAEATQYFELLPDGSISEAIDEEGEDLPRVLFLHAQTGNVAVEVLWTRRGDDAGAIVPAVV